MYAYISQVRTVYDGGEGGPHHRPEPEHVVLVKVAPGNAYSRENRGEMRGVRERGMIDKNILISAQGLMSIYRNIITNIHIKCSVV